MAFFACGDNESSTAPENGNMPESNIVPESSAAQEVLSSSDAFHKESLQRWIKENYVTNMVTIDCPTTGPQEAHSCAEERLRIGANTLTHAWIGHSNYFACETDCEAEQGTYSVDSDGVSFCIVEVPPIPSPVYARMNPSRYIQYDMDCKEHEAHFNSLGNEGCDENACITIAPIRKQFDFSTMSPTPLKIL